MGFTAASGVAEAKRVAGIEDVVMTAKPEQLCRCPRGPAIWASSLRVAPSAVVEAALRDAHSRLAFTIDPDAVYNPPMADS